MLIFVKVKSNIHGTIGLFHIILCQRIMQTKNMIMQFTTLLFLRVLNNLLNEYLVLFLCEDCPSGSAYFTYISSWLSSFKRFWICTRSYFFLANTISNAWSFFLIKWSRYSVCTSTVFKNVVSNKVRYNNAPNSHKYKQSQEKIRSQQPKDK